MTIPSSSGTNAKTLGIIAIIVILAVAAFAYLTSPDRRSTGQKIGDAIDQLPNGVDKAAEQLEDRTPGQKLGDKIEDAGHDIGQKVKENTDNPND